MQHKERHIERPVALCDSKGRLNPQAIGYAKKPVIQSNLKGSWLKKKRWNHWSVYGEDVYFSLVICHLDYAATIYVSFVDLETTRFVSEQIVIPFGRKLTLGDEVFDNTSFQNDQIALQAVYTQDEGHISVTIPQFDNELLHVDLHMTYIEEDDSINVVIPHSRDMFQFTSKHLTLPTDGFIKLGSRRYDLEARYSFSVFDYTRGVWPRQVESYWATASQQIGGRRIGLNFGGKWTDGTGMTENGFMIDGELRKIHEDVLFMHDPLNKRRPWAIRTKFSKNLQMTFTPFATYESSVPLLVGNIQVMRHLGYYNGIVRLKDGQPLRLKQLLGVVEQTKARW